MVNHADKSLRLVPAVIFATFLIVENVGDALNLQRRCAAAWQQPWPARQDLERQRRRQVLDGAQGKEERRQGSASLALQPCQALARRVARKAEACVRADSVCSTVAGAWQAKPKNA